MEPYLKTDAATVYHARAEEVYPHLAPGSVSMVWGDGPYALGKGEWDRMGVDGLADWYAPHIEAWGRVCAPSATVYLWNTAEGWARIDPVMRAAGWTFRGLITWDKGIASLAGRIDTESLQTWPDTTEVCGFYQRNAWDLNSGPAQMISHAAGRDDRNWIREWLCEEWAAAGLTRQAADDAMGTNGMAGHYFGRSQWELPTWERYQTLAALGCELVIRRVVAPVDRRFFVQLLGRGVPPPHNRFRWCTPKLKVEPMAAALAELRGEGDGPKPLLLHGVRIGESAARDGRIALACSKEDSECGQGWYQETLPDSACDKLGPLLHWRVCHVARWLDTWAVREEYGGWDTALLVRAYGGEEAMEAGARTGCVGCPLVTHDHALARILRMQEWGYLTPLTRLRPLYARLQAPAMRLRQPPGELRKDGQPVSKQERLGPLTMEARALGLAELLAIQGEITARAQALRRPVIDLLNADEETRIREFWALGEWPDGWTGEEPVGETTLMPLFQTRGATP